MLSGAFFKHKKILITGHTGFIGSWLTSVFLSLDSDIVGVALDPPTEPNLFSILSLGSKITDVRCDIRDFDGIKNLMSKYEPEIVIHMAAQPLVLTSYENPLGTFSTNVMGTANVMQAAMHDPALRAMIVMTSDKVYRNEGFSKSFVETSALGGRDPYSASKSCQDIVANSFRESYFRERGIGVSIVRSGNVIGGGDWGKNRLVTDLVDSLQTQKPLILRYPTATRPWQHVLEPIYGMLRLLHLMFENPIEYSCAWNFGPQDMSVSVEEFSKKFASAYGTQYKTTFFQKGHPEELTLLLDSSRAARLLDWHQQWNINTAILKTVEWYKMFYKRGNVDTLTYAQIRDYLRNAN